MSDLRRLSCDARDGSPSREVFVLTLEGLDAWPEELPPIDRRFSLRLGLDGRDVATDDFAAWRAFVDRVLPQGLAYFSTWGPDCERLHDLMDETIVECELAEGTAPFLMTTWHADESLEEALEFFRDCAVDPGLQDVRQAPGIIALVGRSDLLDRVKRVPFGRAAES